MKKIMTMLLSLAAMGACANADLVHRYEFNGDTNDSIGEAHGTLGTFGVIEDGRLYTGRDAEGNWIDQGAGPNVNGGVSLPIDAIEGITDQFTIEVWFFAYAPQGAYHTLYCFDDGTTDNHIIATPVRGEDQGWRAGIHVKENVDGLTVADAIMRSHALDVWPDNPDQGPRQMLLTYDGVNLRYYTNGALFTDSNSQVVNTVPVTGLNMQDFVTQIDISAGAPYNDNMLKGYVDDFRIYNEALSEDEVAGIFAIGAQATAGDIQSVIDFTATTPTPEDGADMVGTVVGTGSSASVTVDLAWNTAMDPANPEVFNADVQKHYVYISEDLSDPNNSTDLSLIATVNASGATGEYQVTSLALDGLYKWRVDEGVIVGGAVTGPTDPNSIEGPTWTFSSMPSMPVITTQPMRALKWAGESYDMSIVVDSITTPVYTWYKSTDNVISEDDLIVGTNSDILNFADISSDDAAFYYCAVTNDSEIVVNSAVAQLEMAALVAEFNFENDLNNTVSDSNGTGYVGEEIGEMTYDAGKVGNAIAFNGTDEYVQTECFVRNSYTIEMWVKTEQTAGTGGWWLGAGLVDGEMPGNVADYGVVLSGTGFALGSGPSSTTIVSGKPINDGLWHYCVATRDIDTGDMKVYVDGQMEGTAEDQDTGITQNVTDFLNIGKIRSDSRYFDGMIDEIKIYNYAIDEMTVAAKYVAYEPDASVCIQTLKPSTTLDLHEDCVINVLDFAEIAESWLDCAIYPDCFDLE